MRDRLSAWMEGRTEAAAALLGPHAAGASDESWRGDIDMTDARDDRIHWVTRIVSAVIIPFLVVAFLILYFYPDETSERFAYRIAPPVMAAYVGAGYLGGAYLFLRTLVGRRWHRVAAGFPAVTAFTISMLLVTVLHWSRYSVDDLPFRLWLVLYVVTPVLVPAIWAFNRRRDPGTREALDTEVPAGLRVVVRALGLVMGAFAAVGFIHPPFLVAIWPWDLWPLTARLLAGWGMLLAVSNFHVSFEPRWSSWRIGVQSILLWHVLFLVAAGLHPGDFGDSGLVNWYLLAVVAILLAMVALYVAMEFRIRQATRPTDAPSRQNG